MKLKLILILLLLSGCSTIRNTETTINNTKTIFINKTVNFSYIPPQINYSINLSCPKTECVYEYTTYSSHFQEVINSVCNERDYELNKWDCSDMSEEGVSRLKNAGYEGWHRVCGLLTDNTTEENHCWGYNGRMIIEFTTCDIVHPRDYWKYKKWRN